VVEKNLGGHSIYGMLNLILKHEMVFIHSMLSDDYVMPKLPELFSVKLRTGEMPKKFSKLGKTLKNIVNLGHWVKQFKNQINVQYY
jgi:hypothetical protein